MPRKQMTSSCSCDTSDHCLCDMDQFLVFYSGGNEWKLGWGSRVTQWPHSHCFWVAGIRCMCRCKVQLLLVMKYQGWALLSRWSVCEIQCLACLWCSSEHFWWPLMSNTPKSLVTLLWPGQALSSLAQNPQLCSAELLELMFSFIQRTTVKTFGGLPPSSMHEIICICDSFYPVKLQTPVQRRARKRLRLSLLTDWVHRNFLFLHCWGLVCSRLDMKLNTPVKYKIKCWSWGVFCSFAVIMTCISEIQLKLEVKIRMKVVEIVEVPLKSSRGEIGIILRT